MSRRPGQVVAALLSVVVLVSCEGKPPAGSTSASNSAAVKPAVEVDLFNGKNLDGWVVTECETDVKDGVLLLKAGEGWIRTDKPYANFVLSWECKNLKPTEYDSGVHFRAELPKAPAHWPSMYQVNLKTGQEGNLSRVEGVTSNGLYKPGDWNAFKLTVVGNTAELEINGKPAWKTDQIKAPSGYIGLQSEVTLGGQFEFRNIKIREL